MYEKFFGLTKAPFSLAPDPEYMHLTAQHADAISGLAFGILARKGYLVLTAEAGLGKTTALRSLALLLGESNVQSSVIFSPTLTAPEFLELALLNFGFKDIPVSKAQRLKLLEEFLVRSDANGRVLALIVDEAHQLSPELLEEIRLLGNFESDHHKLLQIVLVGQNELNDRLNLPQLWQLKQRITIRLSLRRLDREAVEEYIQFRWLKSGGEEAIPFSPAALDGIAAWSNGIPRLINVICDNALLIAFAETTNAIDVQIVREACEELSLPTPAIPQRSPSFAGARPFVPAAETSSLDFSDAAIQESPLNGWASTLSETAGEETPPNGWAAARPSLVKRWLRLTDSQPDRPSRSKSSILSLNEPRS
jgi:general secretion pathway protein A